MRRGTRAGVSADGGAVAAARRLLGEEGQAEGPAGLDAYGDSVGFNPSNVGYYGVAATLAVYFGMGVILSGGIASFLVGVSFFVTALVLNSVSILKRDAHFITYAGAMGGAILQLLSSNSINIAPPLLLVALPMGGLFLVAQFIKTSADVSIHQNISSNAQIIQFSLDASRKAAKQIKEANTIIEKTQAALKGSVSGEEKAKLEAELDDAQKTATDSNNRIKKCDENIRKAQRAKIEPQFTLPGSLLGVQDKKYNISARVVAIPATLLKYAAVAFLLPGANLVSFAVKAYFAAYLAVNSIEREYISNPIYGKKQASNLYNMLDLAKIGLYVSPSVVITMLNLVRSMFNVIQFIPGVPAILPAATIGVFGWVTNLVGVAAFAAVSAVATGYLWSKNTLLEEVEEKVKQINSGNYVKGKEKEALKVFGYKVMLAAGMGLTGLGAALASNVVVTGLSLGLSCALANKYAGVDNLSLISAFQEVSRRMHLVKSVGLAKILHNDSSAGIEELELENKKLSQAAINNFLFKASRPFVLLVTLLELTARGYANGVTGVRDVFSGISMVMARNKQYVMGLWFMGTLRALPYTPEQASNYMYKAKTWLEDVLFWFSDYLMLSRIQGVVDNLFAYGPVMLARLSFKVPFLSLKQHIADTESMALFKGGGRARVFDKSLPLYAILFNIVAARSDSAIDSEEKTKPSKINAAFLTNKILLSFLTASVILLQFIPTMAGSVFLPPALVCLSIYYAPKAALFWEMTFDRVRFEAESANYNFLQNYIEHLDSLADELRQEVSRQVANTQDADGAQELVTAAKAGAGLGAEESRPEYTGFGSEDSDGSDLDGGGSASAVVPRGGQRPRHK